MNPETLPIVQFIGNDKSTTHTFCQNILVAFKLDSKCHENEYIFLHAVINKLYAAM